MIPKLMTIPTLRLYERANTPIARKKTRRIKTVFMAFSLKYAPQPAWQMADDLVENDTMHGQILEIVMRFCDK